MKAEDENKILKEALRQAVELIKAWHNADEVWEIYYNNAPEMKMVREAINMTFQIKYEN